MMSNSSKTVIHTALLAEARPLIDTLKLIQNQQHTFIYENETHVLIVSGMGKTQTIEKLTYIFENFNITKAINIGIAGCRDESIAIGTLLCTSHALLKIPQATLTTVDKPLSDITALTTQLVDMEAQYFHYVAQKHLPTSEIYVFKVVSDYLDTSIPKKSFVIELVQNSLKQLKEFL
ncbi:MAG: nucleoside phosphorylase [Candidatus Marinarcus sp.]|uniref:phosphorylase family protein n=1 Tax=Candidatus Marinarcus sp. TaxID=3100987 RepID=UPI003B005A3E